VEEALRQAFLSADDELAGDGAVAGLVGSTTVVALVCRTRVWVANCGDSRAVLCRGGRAVQVTDDHKPEREDEAARVEAAGGQGLFWNGHRVMGVLAMSRAIGDHCLRPYVIPEPEVTVLGTHPLDELLLLASDGLASDAMTNQDAAGLALRSVRRALDKGRVAESGGEGGGDCLDQRRRPTGAAVTTSRS
jgi:protein phosphatase 2C